MAKDLQPLSVSALNHQIRTLLEYDVGEIAVIGELSTLSQPTSGHLYFTLKDKNAQLRCVFFRTHHVARDMPLVSGQQIIAQGKLSLYEARGDYQLIVQRIQKIGSGELYLQFERLKQKLQEMGVFNAIYKKPLPLFPACIGIISSTSGAALQDILTTLKRRYPLVSVCIYPSDVQGNLAASQLVRAIRYANAHPVVDVIILARGGGSAEDLWPFNDEALALEIHHSNIPIITGVGHETDFTIADFVADYRAATPTAAAEAATPNQVTLLQAILQLRIRLNGAITQRVNQQRARLTHANATLLSPHYLIHQHAQSLDFILHRLHQQIAQRQQKNQYATDLLQQRLSRYNPAYKIKDSKKQMLRMKCALQSAIQQQYYLAELRYQQSIMKLEALSPLATLSRGYAIAMHGNIRLQNANQVKARDIIHLQLAQGQLCCQVTEEAINHVK